MGNIDKHLGFVKDQQVVHEKLARRYESEPWRRDRHVTSAKQFSDLADDLVACQRQLDDASDRAAKRGKIPAQNLTLTPEDLDGLPEELVRELSISDADKLEFQILSLVSAGGGVLSLDRILIGLYKATGEVFKRNVMTSKLYRMAQKGLLFSVPGKKGIYSTEEIPEEPLMFDLTAANTHGAAEG